MNLVLIVFSLFTIVHFFIQKENKLFLHDLKDNSTIEIQLDKKMIQNFQVKDQFLFIFTENEISKYQINLP